MTDFLSLPVYRHKDKILDALKDNQVVIVESPTGSGKTTQIPLILKEAGYDEKGIIGITQPRRIATLSICEFIKKQIEDKGNYCAYTMRFDDTSNKDTRIKVMTDGILLQEVKADPKLSRYSVLMIDEAHERSLNIDFILGLVKEIIQKRKDLKIIISSATINAKSFSEFFDNAPIVTIDSKPFPVEVEYFPLRFERDNADFYYQSILKLVKKSVESPEGGDILIFLPGEGEIKDCIEVLKTSSISKKLIIYPLYGRLSKEEQEEVFTPTPSGKRKVVVSTNIAETSVTIDGIRTVIDSGMAKVNFYNQKNYTSELTPVSISRSSADQRKGRAGRTNSGVCYRLYSKDNFEKRPEFNEEEILHSDLAEVVLRMSELGIYNTESFPFITPPMKNALQSAEETLILIGAITEDHHLTAIGEEMIKFPLLPRLSRVIVEAMLNYPNELPSVIKAVSFLSTKSPFVLPPGEELKARDAHRALSDRIYGDFLTFLNLFNAYTSIKDKNERKAYSKAHYLDFQTMEEIEHIDTQLEDIVGKMGLPLVDKFNVAEYFCCLASGLRQYVCKKQDKFSYKSLTASNIALHPGSAWFKVLPEYILAGEVVRTSKIFARTVSPLRYEWLSTIDPMLPELLNKAGKEKKKPLYDNRGRKSVLRNDEDRLEAFKTNIGGRYIYLIPLNKLKDFEKSKDPSKVFIRIGKYQSANTITLNEVKRVLPLFSSFNKVATSISHRPSRINDLKGIEILIDNVYTPYVMKNNSFGFLGLTKKKDKYALVPYATLKGALRESLYALTEILDSVPSSNERLRRKAYKILTKTISASDFN